MDYPLHLRPKFRLLTKIMSGEKPLPLKYRFRMSETYWDFIKDSIIIKMPQCQCSQKLSSIVQIWETLDGRGNGAFAKCDIKKGDYLGCYLGKIKETLNDHEVVYFPDVAYRFELPFENWCVCALDGGNETRFFNHSPNNNICVKGICHESEYHLGFFAERDIDEDDELFIDYGEGYWNLAEKFGIERIETRYPEEDFYSRYSY